MVRVKRKTVGEERQRQRQIEQREKERKERKARVLSPQERLEIEQSRAKSRGERPEDFVLVDDRVVRAARLERELTEEKAKKDLELTAIRQAVEEKAVEEELAKQPTTPTFEESRALIEEQEPQLTPREIERRQSIEETSREQFINDLNEKRKREGLTISERINLFGAENIGAGLLVDFRKEQSDKVKTHASKIASFIRVAITGNKPLEFQKAEGSLTEGLSVLEDEIELVRNGKPVSESLTAFKTVENSISRLETYQQSAYSGNLNEWIDDGAETQERIILAREEANAKLVEMLQAAEEFKRKKARESLGLQDITPVGAEV